MEDRTGAVIFANVLVGYGVALILLVIALIWSAVRSKYQTLVATAGVLLLAAPFFKFFRDQAFAVSERFFA